MLSTYTISPQDSQPLELGSPTYDNHNGTGSLSYDVLTHVIDDLDQSIAHKTGARMYWLSY